MRTDRPPFRSLLIVLALASLVLAVYWPVGRFPFLAGWDDGLYVSGNPAVQRGLSAEGFLWAFRTIHAANWHPLTWLSHMADVDLFGQDAGGHHRMNLFLHALNAALLFLALQALTGAAWRSGVVAGLFAVHPLHVESVALVAERKDLLCALFWILALWAYRRYAQQPTGGRLAPVVAFFLLGLLSKPMIVTLPLVLLLLDWWPLGRFEPEGTGKGKGPEPEIRGIARRLVREKIPLLALSLASVAATFVAQAKGGAVASFRAIPAWDRLANAAVSYVKYIGKAVWPSSLSFFYPHPAYLGRTVPPWQVVGAAAVLSALTALAVQNARRRPWLGVGWLWFLVTLLPVIGVVQVGEQAMADRYAYLPLVGLYIAAVWGIADAAKGRRFREPAVAVLAAAAVAACAFAAHRQASSWRSEAALYERALAVDPDNYLAHNNLGALREREGRWEEAGTHYREAIRIDPSHALALNNLGCVLDRQGRTDEAIASFREALKAQPGYRNAEFNLGNALLRAKRFDEALAQYRDVLRAAPGHAQAHNNAGTALMNMGRGQEALAHFREAVRLDPGYVMARRNLERALLLRPPSVRNP